VQLVNVAIAAHHSEPGASDAVVSSPRSWIADERLMAPFPPAGIRAKEQR
jgi:hypothetical protein